MLHNTEEKKENYMGKIGWYRTSGGMHSMYGTEIKTDHPISLVISESSESRDLSHTWYHTDKEILRIEMSPTQFAEFMTCGNTEGVPCTIIRRDGKKMDEVPDTEILRQYAKESEAAFDDFETGAENIKKVISEQLKSGKAMGKKQMEDLLRMIENYKHNTVSNLAFVRDSFNEDMADIVVKAKSEVNTYVENKALELGMADLKNSIQLAIDNKKEE